MHDGLRLTRQSVANGSALASTMDYSLKRRVTLSRYANSGTLPIDSPGREHNPADRGG
ncbi:hypothetical protein [Pseudomonas taeanensis]|uniref:hypothetical protein n=1 Tax=Pseudomonas taeanensis TaxID=574962 RepID=UPI00389AAC0B